MNAPVLWILSAGHYRLVEKSITVSCSLFPLPWGNMVVKNVRFVKLVPCTWCLFFCLYIGRAGRGGGGRGRRGGRWWLNQRFSSRADWLLAPTEPESEGSISCSFVLHLYARFHSLRRFCAEGKKERKKEREGEILMTRRNMYGILCSDVIILNSFPSICWYSSPIFQLDALVSPTVDHTTVCVSFTWWLRSGPK